MSIYRRSLLICFVLSLFATKGWGTTDSIKITSQVVSPKCAGDTINIEFTKFGSVNDFFIELSDEFGSFGDPDTIGSRHNDGNEVCTLPAGLTGSGFKIRIVCEDLSIISDTIGTYTINAMPDPITGPSEVCEGATITLANTTGGGSWSSSNASKATADATFGYVTGVNDGAVTIRYNVGGCLLTYPVTINQTPAITGAGSVCVASTITLAKNPSGGVWSTSSASANVDASTGVVTGVTGGVAFITYTLGTTCFSTKSVTVNALPDDIDGPVAVCSGSSITLTSGPSGTWSSNAPSVAIVDISTGEVTGDDAGNAVITYTRSTGCYKTFDVTVNPLPGNFSPNSPVICAGGTANKTITLTNASAGGTWTSGTPSLATISPTTGLVTGQDDFTGGNVIMTYTLPTGCAKTKTVTVNRIPALNVVSQTKCKGGHTDATSFGPTSNKYEWTNNNINIGLAAAAGTGDIGSFVTINELAVDAHATIVVHPSIVSTGCANVDQTFTVTVKPSIQVDDLSGSSTTVCDRENIPTIGFTGTALNYDWTNNKPEIGLAISGTGSIASQPVYNHTSATIIATITVTPRETGCTDGASSTFTIAVKPTPTRRATFCNTAICDSMLFADTLSSSVTGASFNWVRPAVTGIAGGSNSGAGDINEFLDNTTAYPIVVTYYDTFRSDGCQFDTAITVKVHPTPHLSNASLMVPTLCNNSSFVFNAQSTTPDSSFTWKRLANAAINGNTSSTASTANPAELLANTSVDSVMVTYVYTVTANGCSNDTRPDTVRTYVMPALALSSSLSHSICNYNAPFNTAAFNYQPKSLATAGITYRYTTSYGTNIKVDSLIASPLDSISNVLHNKSLTRDSITYRYILTAVHGCIDSAKVKVFVNPTPRITGLTDSVICDSVSYTYTPISSVANITSYTWARAGITGIDNATATQTNANGMINERLKLSSGKYVPVTAEYIYTITATSLSCKGLDTFKMTVNPTPRLKTLSIDICSDVKLDSMPTSKTGPGTAFTWEIEPVDARISKLTDFRDRNKDGDTTGAIGYILSTKYSQDPVTVKYDYTMSHRGCIGKDVVTVNVKPTPQKPVISSENMAPCKGAKHQLFSIGGLNSQIASDKVKYTWKSDTLGFNTVGATIEKTSANGFYALLSFNKAGTVNLIDSAYVINTTTAYRECSQTSTLSVTVATTDDASIFEPKILYNKSTKMLFCLRNNVDAASNETKGYVWGYEDTTTLASWDDTTAGKQNQFYYLGDIDPTKVNRRYYAKVFYKGCAQKAYYDPKGKYLASEKPAVTVVVYPNPAQNDISLELSDVTLDGCTAEIFNVMTGKMVYTGNFAGNKTNVEISNLSPGNYIVVCRKYGEKIGSTQFVKN